MTCIQGVLHYGRTPPDGCILGALHDLTKVSLHGCITTGAGQGGNRTEQYHFFKGVPHLVLFGRRHLLPESREVTCQLLRVGRLIFNDFAFGMVIGNQQEHIELVAKAELEHGRQLAVGEHPMLSTSRQVRDFQNSYSSRHGVRYSRSLVQLTGTPWHKSREPNSHQHRVRRASKRRRRDQKSLDAAALPKRSSPAVSNALSS